GELTSLENVSKVLRFFYSETARNAGGSSFNCVVHTGCGINNIVECDCYALVVTRITCTSCSFCSHLCPDSRALGVHCHGNLGLASWVEVLCSRNYHITFESCPVAIVGLDCI